MVRSEWRGTGSSNYDNGKKVGRRRGGGAGKKDGKIRLETRGRRSGARDDDVGDRVEWMLRTRTAVGPNSRDKRAGEKKKTRRHNAREIPRLKS